MAPGTPHPRLKLLARIARRVAEFNGGGLPRRRRARNAGEPLSRSAADDIIRTSAAAAHRPQPRLRSPQSRPREGSSMSIRSCLSAAAITACLLPSASNAQVLNQRDVSLAMGIAMAEAAVAECAKAGNDVSVAVV